MSMQQDERRRYFRVTDLVGLSYRLLDDGERELAIMAQPSSLKSLLAQLDEKIMVALQSVKSVSSELHLLLDLFNQKINLAFGHGIAAQSEQYEHAMKACQVNLSACGIAFPSKETAQLNQYMLLELTLFPNNVKLQLLAAVISCEEHPEATDNCPYLIRADFTNITDADQELLVQHVLKRQGQQLKEQREQVERNTEQD
ncbi:MAG: PilZ domain-containing protein [Oleiphilaceae bacterium]|nr:PilZ domain-containing protein [Oleiphilaceae bacterium]